MTTKRDITAIIGILFGLITSIWSALSFGSWLIHLVPASEPHASVIRVVIGFVALWTLGGLGVMLAIGWTLLCAWIGYELVGSLFYKRG